MILADTSVWIDYFNGKNTRQTDLLNLLSTRDVIIVGDLIFIEILQGFDSDHDFNTAKKLLSNFVQVNLLNQNTALKSAENFRLLRKKGVTVRKTIDMIIATYCIDHHIPLLHADKDFDRIAQHLKLQIL